LFRILAVGKGQLLQPRFNIGREMYFHVLQGTRKTGINATGCQPAADEGTLC
jgi:hypothetical protein